MAYTNALLCSYCSIQLAAWWNTSESSMRCRAKAKTLALAQDERGMTKLSMLERLCLTVWVSSDSDCEEHMSRAFHSHLTPGNQGGCACTVMGFDDFIPPL